VKLGAHPTPVGELLWGQEVQAEREMELHWGAVQRWLGGLLADRGVMDIAAEELSVPPGMDELFSLLQIKRHHESGEFDVVIVDCAPTGETLRLLSFPDIAHWWLEKVFGWERRIVAAAKPLARLIDVQIPETEVFDDAQRLIRNLIALNEILRDRDRASIRLVMNPDRMVIKEAQRTFTYLNLYGYLTDAVVVNRIFPEEVEGGYFGAWRAVQREHMELVRSAFSPVPILTAPYFEHEVMGDAMLDRLADSVFPDRPAGEVLHEELSQELVADNGRAELRVLLPFAEKGDIDLRKIGLELIVRVGPQKRTIMLPAAMAAYRPRGARFEEGALHVSFERSDERLSGDPPS
jgi:arsenite-transporting ATPase